MPRMNVVKRLPRVLDLERVDGELPAAVDLRLEQRVDQRVLVREAAIDGADADARGGGDLVERDVEPALGEERGGGREHPLAVALGVGAQWSWDDGHGSVHRTIKEEARTSASVLLSKLSHDLHFSNGEHR